jgi:DNA recombination protein RmuC
VRKYIDPNLTVGYAVAVVPDAVYELCGGIQAEAFSTNVVLVGQSLFLPYLLLVFQTVLKASQTIDVQRFELYVSSCQQDIAGMQEELEGRFSRATTMLENSRREIAGGLARGGPTYALGRVRRRGAYILQPRAGSSSPFETTSITTFSLPLTSRM